MVHRKVNIMVRHGNSLKFIYEIATQAHLELCPGSIDVRSISMLQDVNRKKRRSSESSAGSHRIHRIQRISAINSLNSKT